MTGEHFASLEAMLEAMLPTDISSQEEAGVSRSIAKLSTHLDELIKSTKA